MTVVTSTPPYGSGPRASAVVVWVTATKSISSHKPTASLVTSISTTSRIHPPTQETSLPSATSSGLSTPSKAAIGVGTVIGAAAVFCLILWLFWALRKRRKNTANLFQGLDTNEPELKDNTRSS
jgi:hypothetical protein